MPRILLSALLLAVFSLSCQRGAPLEIAYVAPVEGPGAEATKRVLQALELLVEDLNQSSGRRVKIRTYDDKGDPEIAKQVAAQIAKSGAIGVVGHRTNACSLAAAPIYRDAKIPAITPAAGDPRLTRGNDWYFRTVYGATTQARFAAGYAKTLFGASSLSVPHVKGSWILSLVTRTATSAGVAIGVSPAIPINATAEDYDRAVDALAREDSAAPILLALTHRQGIEVVRRLRDRGVDRPLIAPTQFESQEFLGGFSKFRNERLKPGYYTDGVYFMTPSLVDLGSATTTQLVRRFALRHGYPMPLEGLLTYDAVLVLADGARAAGPGTRDEIRQNTRDWIASRHYATSIQSATGPVYFDENGDRVRSAFLVQFHRGHPISVPTQLRILPAIHSADDLPMGVTRDRLIEIEGQTLYRTDVLFVGMLLQEVYEFDLDALTFKAHLDLWVRHQEGIEGWDLEFLNAHEPIELGEPVEFIRENGIEYRRFSVTGKFDADFVDVPYGKHVLGFSIRHRTLTRDAAFVGVDLAGMGVGAQKQERFERFKKVQEVLPPNLGWLVYDGFFQQDTYHASSLGRPRDDGVPPPALEYSRLDIGVRIQRSDLSPRTLTPERLARPLLLVSLLFSLVLLVLWRQLPNHGRSLFVLQALFVGVLLLSAEQVLGEWVNDVFPTAYERMVRRSFGMLWWLAPAAFLHVGLHRFVWRPLEIESGRAVPSILRRMVAFTIYLLAFFGVLAFVFDQKLTSLLATSGVIAMIVGLAIQINITNIFSGMALNVERPFRIGDWIHVHGRNADPAEGIVGQVIDINWRTTRIRTTDNIVVVIPNGVISEKTITNFMLPDESSRFELMFYLDYAVPETQAIELITKGLEAAAKKPTGPLKEPRAKVRVNATTELGVEYLVRYWLVPREVSPAKARHTINESVLSVLRDAGVELAYPKRSILGPRPAALD